MPASSRGRWQSSGWRFQTLTLISQIEGFSGHTDADELMRWLAQFRNPPKQTFVVHGERDAADALRLRVHDQLGWAVNTVEHLQSVLV